MLEQALLYPRQSVELGMSYKNIMSVNVPVYSFRTKNNDPSRDLPLRLRADQRRAGRRAGEAGAACFEDMLELAQVEKTMQLLAEEIEKTRRRVNALEYVMIPNFEENIRYITMKLEENENSTKVRLHEGQGHGPRKSARLQILRREPSIRRALFLRRHTHPAPTRTSPCPKSGEERIVHRLAALTRMVEPPG